MNNYKRTQEWFFSKDGEAAYYESKSFRDRVLFFFDYLCAVKQDANPKTLYKFAYIMADTMCESSLPFGGYPNILDKGKNPILSIPQEEMFDIDIFGEIMANTTSISNAEDTIDAMNGPGILFFELLHDLKEYLEPLTGYNPYSKDEDPARKEECYHKFIELSDCVLHNMYINRILERFNDYISRKSDVFTESDLNDARVDPEIKPIIDEIVWFFGYRKGLLNMLGPYGSMNLGGLWHAPYETSYDDVYHDLYLPDLYFSFSNAIKDISTNFQDTKNKASKNKTRIYSIIAGIIILAIVLGKGFGTNNQKSSSQVEAVSPTEAVSSTNDDVDPYSGMTSEELYDWIVQCIRNNNPNLPNGGQWYITEAPHYSFNVDYADKDGSYLHTEAQYNTKNGQLSWQSTRYDAPQNQYMLNHQNAIINALLPSLDWYDDSIHGSNWHAYKTDDHIWDLTLYDDNNNIVYSCNVIQHGRKSVVENVNDYHEKPYHAPAQLGRVTVLVKDLRIRTSPSIKSSSNSYAQEQQTYEVLGIVEADGYTWYCIGPDMYIASGDWLVYSPQ